MSWIWWSDQTSICSVLCWKIKFLPKHGGKRRTCAQGEQNFWVWSISLLLFTGFIQIMHMENQKIFDAFGLMGNSMMIISNMIVIIMVFALNLHKPSDTTSKLQQKSILSGKTLIKLFFYLIKPVCCCDTMMLVSVIPNYCNHYLQRVGDVIVYLQQVGC